MHNRRLVTTIACSLFCLAALILSLPSLGTGSKSRTADPWGVFKDCDLSSVVWSPKGDYIAFVAAKYKDDEDDGLLRASIWMLPTDTGKSSIKLRRLATLTRKEGIPAALFWPDNGRLGWAAITAHSSRWDDTFSFVQMGINDGKPRRLVNRTFTGVQRDQPQFSAPNDVYYDPSSGSVLFSGGMTPIGVFARIVHLADGRVRDLSVPHPQGLVYPKGYLDMLTLCGTLGNPKKPVFYISAAVASGDSYGWQLWRSDSYSLKQAKIISTLGLFPRISPDGKRLARIILDDLRRDTLCF